MRKLGLTAGVIAGAILLAATIRGHTGGDSKAEITEIEKQALAASTADELVKFYDQTDIITYDYIPPLQYVGAKAVHADVDKFFSKTRDLKGDFVDLKVETDGTMGVAHSLQHFTWKGPDGATHEATFRVTNCYHRVAGQWKIFHMHTSFPIDPTTGKAQMSLRE
jgi:ketosteroid isomerase-like protein